MLMLNQIMLMLIELHNIVPVTCPDTLSQKLTVTLYICYSPKIHALIQQYSGYNATLAKKKYSKQFLNSANLQQVLSLVLNKANIFWDKHCAGDYEGTL